MDRALSSVLLVITLLLSCQLKAWELYDEEKDDFYIMAATYTHFNDSDDHEGPAVLGSIEIVKPNRHFYGIALFNNSFGQFSQYIFYGKEYRFDDTFQGLRAKVSGGAIFGYRDEHEDDLFLNEDLGFAPVILPSIGFQRKRLGIDLYLLADAGILLGIGYQFD